MTHSDVISQVARHYRKCNASECGGEMHLFHYKWCRQYRLRCDRCGKSIKDVIYEQNRPSVPVEFLMDAIKHELAERVWQKFAVLEFNSFAEIDRHFGKAKQLQPTLF